MFRKNPSVVIYRATCSVFELLESRQMLSASLSSHGILKIHGTGHADAISVSLNPQDSNLLDVSLNGTVKSFNVAKVKSIKLNAGAGGDTVDVDSAVTVPATLQGSSGNDTLVAGGGNDSLDGGTGADSLTGGSGSDTLAGSTGNDTLQCGSGSSKVNGGPGKDNVQFDPAAGVALDTLSQAVQTGLTTLAQGATITAVQTFKDNQQTYYGTVVTIDGVSTRIVVDSKGNPVGNPPPKPHTKPVDNGSGDSNDGPVQNDGVFGTVVKVDATASTITISATNPWGPATKTTFKLTSGTVITADGSTVALSSLTAGTWVSVQTSTTDATTAASITAIDRRVHGDVTAIDTTALTLSITNAQGKTATYNIASSATVTIDSATSTLADVTVGSHVELTIGALAGTVLAIDTDPQKLPPGSGDEVDPAPAPGGAIVSIAGNTITLHDKAGIETTYKLATNVTVTLNAISSTLAALLPTDRVKLTLSSDGQTVTAIAATDPASDQNDNPDGGDNQKGPHGLVTAVNSGASTITLQDQTGTITTYTVASNAVITLDGAASTLSALIATDHAGLKLSTDGTQVVAIDATDQTSPVQNPPTDGTGNGDDTTSPHGLISAIDTADDTITLKGPNGASTTYTFSSDAIITLDGATSTLSALTTNDHAGLKLSADGTTVIAVDASDEPGAVQNPPTNGTDDAKGPHGLLTTINTTARTITLKDESGLTTYTVATNAVITLDGAASSLAALATGDSAGLKLSTDNTTVVAIQATDGTSPTQNPPTGAPGSKDDARGPHGLIAAIDLAASTITLQASAGVSTTYAVASNAVITVDNAASTLSALTTTDHAGLKLSNDGTKVIAIQATDNAVPVPTDG